MNFTALATFAFLTIAIYFLVRYLIEELIRKSEQGQQSKDDKDELDKLLDDIQNANELPPLTDDERRRLRQKYRDKDNK